MKTRTIISIGGALLLLIILRNISGGGDTPVVTESTRTPKIIETQVIGLGDFSEQVSVIGRVSPVREAVVSTQGTGFIGAVFVDVGSQVVAGSVLASIADTYGLTGYSLEEAEIGVTSAQLTRDNTLVSLQQSLESARISLERAQKDYDATQLSSNSDTFSKAELDLQNYITIQEQTLAWYETTYLTMAQSLQSYITNVLDSVDTLMGVSPEKDENNDHYEYLLSALDSQKKVEAEEKIRELLRYKHWTPNQSLPLLERIKEMENIYLLVSQVLSSVETVLIKSVTDASLFTESTRTAQRALIDAYQSQYSWATSWLVSYYNTAQIFLATYEKERLSKKQWAEIGAENSLNALELAKKTYASAQKSYDIGISQSQQSVTSAWLRLLNASGNVAKLSVTAPFSGVIIARNAEVGNLASPGAHLFTLGDVSQMIVRVDISVEQQKYLTVGEDIPLYYNGRNIMGKLANLSAGPDPETRLYSAQMTLSAGHKLSLWDIVEVVLPGKTLTKASDNGQIVLPFSALKNLWQETYAVFVFVPDESRDGTGIVRERMVKIGETNENSVTISEGLSLGERVIVIGALGVDDGDYARDPALNPSLWEQEQV
jgi:multidrug efflux pump subunit AcrA (membrane-fusion protein)